MSHYQINRPRIVDEHVDGEYIIIDTQSGSYYSFEGPAAWIWDQLVRGRSEDQILEIARSGGGSETHVRGFIAGLLKESLILASGPQPENANLPDPVPFQTGELILKKFDDMQEYLLADPIHDIGPEGWPHPPADKKNDPS